MDHSKVCAECKFFDRSKPYPETPDKIQSYGLCRINPPVVIGNEHEYPWPYVSADIDWCGKWCPKPLDMEQVPVVDLDEE